MKCPFVYANGKNCQGYINNLELPKADVSVILNDIGDIQGIFVSPRYHVHLHCSLKGNHAGHSRSCPDSMKVWFGDLPKAIQGKLPKGKTQA